jgi:hypothetical protein
MANLLVSPQQAALNALALWLTSNLPPYAPLAARGSQGVEVSDRWPDHDKRLPERAVTVLLAGPPREEGVQPEVTATEVIHAAAYPTPIPVPVVATDADAGAALNMARASYELHRVSAAAHASADATNAIVSPASFDQPSRLALANELAQKLPLHYASASHATPDRDLVVSRVGTVTGANLHAAALSILKDLNRHYAARLYTYRLADLDQPVQLDLWATNESFRDDLWQLLEPLLNAPLRDSAGPAFADVAFDSIRYGVCVPLGDGWPGCVADFDFDAPQRVESPDAVQRDEFRMTFRGSCGIFRTVKRQEPRLTRATLAQTVVGETALSQTTVVTASGQSLT